MKSIRRSSSRMAAISFVGFLVLHAGSASAAGSLAYQAIVSAAPEPSPPAGPTTPEEMESFVDGFMAAQMASGAVAGTTVSVVKDGKLFFAKGYGFADVEKQVPVDAGRTLFRPGSISKLFTWTSVMQLVEQGRIDLDADVNTYLKDLKIPETQSHPITLRNLMTHTQGLEDGMTGFLFAASEEKDLLPLSVWLAEHLPTRARPPTRDFGSGTNASYSNWGVALAGHIVATVSGMSYDDYVEKNILRPLGMQHSTFREPLPTTLALDMSGGYMLESGALARKGFELIHRVGPAGSLSAPATDMAQFMLAYLQGGALESARILRPETVRQIFTRTMSPDPALNGSALGFYETWINGRRVIGHVGDTDYFHSMLALLPEENLGLFVSVNTGGHGAEIPVGLERAFVRHYFPAHLPQVNPPADAVRRNARYSGTYRTLRRSYTTFEKILATEQDLRVRPVADGTLFFPDPYYLKPARWVEVGDGVFRKINDDVFVAFKFKGGEVEHSSYLVGPFPLMAAERVRWYETRESHEVITGIAGVLFTTLLVSAIRRRREDRAGPANIRWARFGLALAGVLLMAFVVGFERLLASGELTLFSVPTALYELLAMPLLSIPLIVFALVCTVRLWRSGEWLLGARLHYTVTTLAALILLWILNYWNLVGYRFG